MNGEPILNVVFFQTGTGREPVREWLKSLDKEDRKGIGEDIKLVQFRWPLGMPLVRKMEQIYGKFAVISVEVASRGYSSPLEVTRWHSCMALSRSPRKHLKEI